MSTNRLIQKVHLILITIIPVLIIITSSVIGNHSYFDVTKVVYGQPDPDHTNSNSTNSVNMQDIPLEKVHVGDIISYIIHDKIGQRTMSFPLTRSTTELKLASIQISVKVLLSYQQIE
jgi:hypothetical protein